MASVFGELKWAVQKTAIASIGTASAVAIFVRRCGCMISPFLSAISLAAFSQLYEIAPRWVFWAAAEGGLGIVNVALQFPVTDLAPEWALAWISATSPLILPGTCSCGNCVWERTVQKNEIPVIPPPPC